MSGPVVVARDVAKRFRVRDEGAARTIKGSLLGGGRGRPRDVWALDGVDLEVGAGEAVGLIGRNGAGKTTLLRLLGGVGRPTRGTVELHGRVAALLELGLGFHEELTGRESAQTAAVIAGLGRAQARASLDEIVAFAELEDAIDAPLRTYSTGMRARLGFSIAVHTRPEVMLVDEVLAVGDLAFQQRCLDRIRTLRRDGAALLLVSHDPGAVVDLCERAVWLDDGRVRRDGPALAVVEEYTADSRARVRASTPDAPDGQDGLRLGSQRWGTQEVRVTAGWLDGDGGRTIVAAHGATVRLALEVRAPGPRRGRLQVRVHADRRQLLDISDDWACGDGGVVRRIVEVEALDLSPSRYDVSVGCYSADWNTTWDYHERAYAIHLDGATAAGRRSPWRPTTRWRTPAPDAPWPLRPAGPADTG